MEAHKKNLKIKNLGIQDYNKTWDSMLNKILSRSEIDEDEVWILEHKPVYTLGFNASEDDILNQEEIPIVRTDRGGKTTWDNVGSRNLPLHNGRDIANGCRNRATDIVDQSHHSGNDH